MDENRAVIGDEFDADEVAAVMAALQMYMATSARRGATIDPAERWTRAGRLEAQGIPVTIPRLSPGWRI